MGLCFRAHGDYDAAVVTIYLHQALAEMNALFDSNRAAFTMDDAKMFPRYVLNVSKMFPRSRYVCNNQCYVSNPSWPR